RRVAARPAYVAGRTLVSMAGPDPPAISDSHRQYRDAWRLVDAARPDGQLRATVSVLAVRQSHLPRDHGAGAVSPPANTAEYAEALPRHWLPLGARTLPGGNDGTG